MGKNDFLTPKAIANRIKAKGLQKLRWYCQMCQKQCRDENGFKCHCMSEGHQRQMQVFGHNPERFVEGYSEEFLETFMEHMRRCHRFSRVSANIVYNEYIQDRHHVHMNSTRWLTLTDFVKFLGVEGLCKVEDTPKGWFITYIDRESETLFKEGQKLKRERAELAEEERHAREIEAQIERAAKTAKVEETPVELEKKLLQRDPDSGAKIAFGFSGSSSKQAAPPSTKRDPAGGEPAASKQAASAVLFFDEDAERPSDTLTAAKGGAGPKSKGKSTLEALMEEQERVKERSNRKNYWLAEGIVVKVLSKSLKERGYYKEKGVVRKVVDKYVGEIEMLCDGTVVRVDQAELETVLPKLGGLVRIVNGAYRGCLARLLDINTEKFSARLRVEKGAFDGRELASVEYEDFCKVHVS